MSSKQQKTTEKKKQQLVDNSQQPVDNSQQSVEKSSTGYGLTVVVLAGIFGGIVALSLQPILMMFYSQVGLIHPQSSNLFTETTIPQVQNLVKHPKTQENNTSPVSLHNIKPEENNTPYSGKKTSADLTEDDSIENQNKPIISNEHVAIKTIEANEKTIHEQQPIHFTKESTKQEEKVSETSTKTTTTAKKKEKKIEKEKPKVKEEEMKTKSNRDFVEHSKTEENNTPPTSLHNTKLKENTTPSGKKTGADLTEDESAENQNKLIISNEHVVIKTIEVNAKTIHEQEPIHFTMESAKQEEKVSETSTKTTTTIKKKEKKIEKEKPKVKVEKMKTKSNNVDDLQLVDVTGTHNEVPDEVKNFKKTKISMIKTKKLWIPIPNSNGGHRRVPPVEVCAGKTHGSSVKIWLFDEFLSKQECDNLIKVHKEHVSKMQRIDPIICFDSIKTLRKHLNDLRPSDNIDVTPNDFTKGTMCLNATFSSKLKEWGLKWSYSTAFYPGESPFSDLLAKRIEEGTAMDKTHGGKFQITSYPKGVGYKDHQDCTIGGGKQDRYGTFLVYLNDVFNGGETVFKELGIDIKPKAGRALVWNSMNENGVCEETSIHRANNVEDEDGKYILQRWYYYENFFSLGKRPPEPNEPERKLGQARVSCDEYDMGSCRAYDEWNYDHLIKYRNAKHNLI